VKNPTGLVWFLHFQWLGRARSGFTFEEAIMKPRTRLLLTLLLANLVPPAAWAGNPLAGCHRLMTEKECDEHKAQLAQLPRGEARGRYLEEHARLLREREAACSCTRATAAMVPVSRQSLLEF